MTPARWELVTAVFQAALEKTASARMDFVRQACAGDLDLELQVKQLLAADENAGSFLKKPSFGSVPDQHYTDHPHLLPPGSVLSSRFEIIRLLGQGGMGQVYEALDLRLNTRIALKAINPEISSNPQVLSRFRREVLLTRKVTHPNVCRTFDIDSHTITDHDTDGVITFLTMELLEGETLAALLSREGRLNHDVALLLVFQMIEALGAAHDAGIIHRDFKPSNVVLVSAKNRLRAVVTDFGLARAILPDDHTSAENVAHSLTRSEGLLGTLVYMAPEQLERGEATQASDVYALGLVMYEMITGRRPFADPIPFAEAVKRLKQAPTPVRTYSPTLDANWEAVVNKCLESDARSRFSSVREVGQALHGHWIASPVTSWVSRRVFSLPTNSLLFSRKRILRFSVVVVVLVALSLGILRLINWKNQDSKVQEGSTILLTDISNESHDPELNGTTELLRNQLLQSKYMNLVEPNDVTQALERMSLPPSQVLAPQLAREVALRDGVPLVVFGTISRVADDYRLDLKAERVGNDPSHPRASWQFSETSPTKRDFFEVIHRGGLWIRRLVGEAEADIQNADRRPEDVTTNSWTALKIYSEGQKYASLGKLDEAALLFKEAGEKDPEFAMAWMRLGDTLDTIGKSGEGFSFWRKALVVSGDRRLTQREELRIKGMYASDTGDLKAAVDYFGQYSIAYPNDYLGFFYRGVPLMLLGRTEEAVQMLHEAEQRNPGLFYVPDHLARYMLILGDLDSTTRYTSRVRQMGHRWWADEVDGQASVVAGDYGRAEKLFLGLREADDPFLRSVRFYLLASSLAEQGRYKDAIRFLNDGVAADLPAGDAADRADKLLGLAYLHFIQGDREAGRVAALKSVEAEPGVRRIAQAGSLLARAGFMADAERLSRTLNADDTAVVTKVAFHRLRGEILLAQKRCRPALAEFETAKAVDQEQALLQDYWAHALLVCSRSDEAAVEYEKLWSRSRNVWHQPEFYEPGLRADLLFAYAQALSRAGKPQADAIFSQYRALRRNADFDLRDVHINQRQNTKRGDSN
jgi:serine/threonine protein kinase/predicted Zn-dependent protease